MSFIKKNILKLIGVFIGFILLLFVSEILYAYRNESLNNILIYYNLTFFRHYYQKNDKDKTINYLYKLTNQVLKYRQKIYDDSIKDRYLIESVTSNKEYIFTLLSNKPSVMQLFKNPNIIDVELSLLYYYFAINSDSPDNIPNFLNIALSLDPDLSFYYVELSNYYLSVGNVQSAELVLINCMNLIHPKLHCEDYYENVFKVREYQLLGFLRNDIYNYFQSRNFPLDGVSDF